MKNFLVFILLGLIVSSCSSTSGTKNSGGPLAVSFEEFQKILRLGQATAIEGEDAFYAAMTLPGDEYRKLYRYDVKDQKFSVVYDHGSAIFGVQFDRPKEKIYVYIDDNGDENYGLYRLDVEKKQVSPVFVMKGRRIGLINTDKTGKKLFLGSNHVNKAVFAVYLLDTEKDTMTLLSDPKENTYGTYVSPEGKFILGTRSFGNNENWVFSIDVATKKRRLLFKRKATNFWPAFVGKDGKIYGSTNYKRDRMGCASLQMRGRNRVSYVLESNDADYSCYYSERADRYFVSNRSRGKSSLSIYKKFDGQKFSEPMIVPEVLVNQSVSVVDYDKAGGRFLARFSASNSPGQLRYFDGKSNDSLLAIDVNRSRFKSKDLAESYDFDFESFDGKNIHGILFAKKDWKASGKKYPVIVWPHGGPDSHVGHSYSGLFQYLVLNGYVVYAPNFRGSTGYGKKFETLNDRDWGGGHIKDVVMGKNKLAEVPYIDHENSFIFGCSFGGYSTLAAITFHPKEFKAASACVAIGNLFTFMESIPPDEAWQSEFKTEMGDPVKDKALYRERSPFFHTDNVAIPLTIFQAENDVRTVLAEMDTYVEELKKSKKDVTYTVLKDVGHGIGARPEALKTVLEETVRFFNRH